MNYVILAMRAALVVVCIETAIRYAIWWVKVGPQFHWHSRWNEWRAFFRVLVKGDQNGILPPLMLGIAVAQAGIAIRHLDIFYYAESGPPAFWLWIVLASDILMFGGTILHLMPAWEMAPNALNSSIREALIVRLGLIAAVCAGIIALDIIAPNGIR